ncbi:SMC-Scp complex subunit ScpB [Niallia sp. Sow4_A1]|uniref:SMC-Scp complex subunit ScpB n=1 Tax=unclassified Niallia TaxID=2837522 RepID=UPI002040C2E2|nr:SMC-Scp complex subunit ScpB [Niallia sp. MER TA 168]MCM3361837.1 SMC-Scp complex subunit ScpB [Niallia sp. MER TA 168]
MKVNDWKAIVESLLFAAGDEGLTIKQLMHVLDLEQLEVEQLVDELIKNYRKDKSRGISIIEIAGTYQFATKKEHSDYLKKLVESPHASTLSQAALETLAIVAYKQPITRAEIEDIRGVKTERPLHTLAAKALIKEVGRADGAGRAILYGTTKEFLDHFGLKNLGELPPLTEKEEEFNQEEADLFFESFQQIED